MKSIFLLLLSILCFTVSVFTQNIGIGIATPAFKLDVKNGSINTDSVYRIGGKRVLSTNLQNTFVGIGIASLATGDYNTAVGNEALYSNTTGERNTALGLWALYSNATGNYNTGVGKSALHLNLDGSGNTAQGYEALYYNTASFNTAVGYHALLQNTSGPLNTANGYAALARNTTGSSNTAQGTQALFYNTSGSYNTAMGYQALYSNSYGRYNTAQGYRALYGNLTGFDNTAIGVEALYSNTSGEHNTAIGHHSDVTSGSFLNATVIGYAAEVDASNKVRIGNTVVTSIGGQVGWTNFSDSRYKLNIREDVPGLSFVTALRPVTYTVDTKSLDENYYKLKPGIAASTNTSYRHTGFIAQEVERSAAALNYSFSGVDKPQQPDGLYGLRYAEFVVPLVKAVQEQQQQVNHLQVEIELLKEQNKLLIQQLNKKNRE
ncbi:MAG: tail fiber domain-containing protein [Bacteroidota bacterium]